MKTKQVSESNHKKLSEICKIILSGTPKTSIPEYWNGDINWITPTDITKINKRYIYNTERKITKEGILNSSAKLLKKDTIVISARGTVGKLCIVPSEMSCNQSCYALESISELVRPLYLFYVLKNLKNVYSQIAHGTTFDTITMATFDEIKITLPSLDEQDKLIPKLDMLDSKIENLQKQNKVLEQIAHSIFKSWFVDFDGVTEFDDSELGKIPKGWQVGTFVDVIEKIESGTRPKGGIDSTEKEIPSIGAENIIGLGQYDYSKTKYITSEFFNEMKVGKIKHNDVLLYKDGASLGRKSLFRNDFPFKQCCINEHVFILRPNKKISPSFLFFWLDQDWMEENVQNLNSNSAQPGINRSSVVSLPILIPNSIIVDSFQRLIEPLLTKFFKNLILIRTLTITREALLPKLMSGEIKV